MDMMPNILNVVVFDSQCISVVMFDCYLNNWITFIWLIHLIHRAYRAQMTFNTRIYHRWKILSMWNSEYTSFSLVAVYVVEATLNRMYV